MSSQVSPATVSQAASAASEEILETKSKKCRAKYWTEAETGALIDLWATEKVQVAFQNQFHNKAVYTWISAEMAKQGFNRSGAQCKERLNSQKKKFKEIANHNKRSGVEPRTMAHYDKLAVVLLNRRNVTPRQAAGSGAPVPDKRQRVSKMVAAPAALPGPPAAASSSSTCPPTFPACLASRVKIEPPESLSDLRVLPPTCASVQQLATTAVANHTGALPKRAPSPIGAASPASQKMHLGVAVSGNSEQGALPLDHGSPSAHCTQTETIQVVHIDEHGRTLGAGMYAVAKEEEEDFEMGQAGMDADPAVLRRTLEESWEASSLEAQSTPESSALHAQGEQFFAGISASLFHPFGSKSLFEACNDLPGRHDDSQRLAGDPGHRSLSEAPGQAVSHLEGDEGPGLEGQPARGQRPPSDAEREGDELRMGGARHGSRPLTNAERAARLRNRKKTDKVLLAKELVMETARTNELTCQLLRDLDEKETERRADDRRFSLELSKALFQAQRAIVMDSTNLLCATVRECSRNSDAAFDRSMQAHTTEMRRIADFLEARANVLAARPPPPLDDQPHFAPQQTMETPSPAVPQTGGEAEGGVQTPEGVQKEAESGLDAPGLCATSAASSSAPVQLEESQHPAPPQEVEGSGS